ncbi:MAG: hypothetical protein ACK4SA_18760, partial [Caldilinea sp.]
MIEIPDNLVSFDCGAALNPVLYARLQRVFGDVEIANEGQGMIGVLQRDVRGVFFGMRHAGEYYRVSCPFCYDTRKRLWIHHRWGVGPDPPLNNPMWWAAVCFNEDCLSRFANLKRLVEMVQADDATYRHSVILSGDTQIALREVGDPGVCVPITQLPEEHQAVRYLASRGFDVQRLGQQYAVKFCLDGGKDFPYITGGILIPIYMEGRYVSWQRRLPFEANWKALKMPKYFTCPGSKKSQLLYGYDQAAAAPFALVVEGITDVWALGSGAVAILGKTLSQRQEQLLLQRWRKLVFLLDLDAW